MLRSPRKPFSVWVPLRWVTFLGKSLSIDEEYEADEIPSEESALAEFLWEEMVDSAREDGQVRSFFVVRRTSPSNASLLYVSGDWPSAESYTQQLLAH